MKLTKIRIKNLFGIKECELSEKDVEIIGGNGVGKTSIIDAIKYALKNRSDRNFIIKNGEEEGEVYIETDSGISVNRRIKTGKSDYKSIKDGDKPAQNPENFLRNIFTELQLNPIEFIHMDEKEQNRIILDMIEFEWDLKWIEEQFGEIVPQVNYEQNILNVLYEIQKDDGYYFQKRQDLNREVRHNLAHIEDIGASLPENYSANNWKEFDLGAKYTEIESKRKKNAEIENAINYVKSNEERIAAINNDAEVKKQRVSLALSEFTKEKTAEIEELKKRIITLENNIESEKELTNHKIKEINERKEKEIKETVDKAESLKELSQKPLENIEKDIEEANYAKSMIEYLKEYERMVDLQDKVGALKVQSEKLTGKIEHARNLPIQILETANIPIEGITVENGMPLINGLPINNLSEGEKLKLCIDVAIKNKTNLNMLLLDGIERLSETNRENLYKKLKENNVQFIATRTTNDNELIVKEL